MGVFGKLIDFVYPRECVGCGRLEVSLCDECKREWSVAAQRCIECGRESVGGWTHKECRRSLGIEGMTIVYDYKDELTRKALRGVREGFNRELLMEITGGLSLEVGMEFDLVVPVPLSFWKKNWRGFNQSFLLAEKIGKKLGIEVIDCLEKRGERGMKKEMEKKVKKKGTFGLKEGSKKSIEGKKILLIDDFLVSGATMRKCGGILKRGGVEKVWGLVLAG